MREMVDKGPLLSRTQQNQKLPLVEVFCAAVNEPAATDDNLWRKKLFIWYNFSILCLSLFR